MSDRWVWGTVTDDDPLRVRLDGDTAPLDLTPDAMAGPLAIGDRVYCHMAGRRIVAFGLALPASGIDAAAVTSGRFVNDRLPATTAIPAGVDLDTFLTPGVWGQHTSANATFALHYPVELAGLLEVQARGSGAAMVWQRYSPYVTSASGRRFFQRRHYNGSWSDWDEYVPRGQAGSPFAVAAGSVTVSMSSSVSGTATVTFPASRFSVAPIVQLTKQSAAGPATLLVPMVTAVSSSGCTVGLYGPSAVTVDVPVHWTATQMTSSAAAG